MMANNIANLRTEAENLRLWMNSVVEQRNDWNGGSGVEVNARDALQIGFRIAATVTGALNAIANEFEARTTKDNLTEQGEKS